MSTEPRKPNIPSLTSLELFAGAGGMALGVHQAGFEHLALVERNDNAAQTLKNNINNSLNISPDRVYNGDVRDFNFAHYLDQVDLLTGGPPCQPFSTGGRNRGPNDDRDMFPAFLNVVEQVMPKAVMIENVRGLLRKNFENYFNYILLRLQYPLLTANDEETWKEHYERLLSCSDSDFLDEEQYVVGHQLIDTADYGIPQRRIRVIITAFRRDLGFEPIKIQPTHSKEALLISQWITEEYWEKHGATPYDYLTKTDKNLVEKLKKAPQLIPKTKLPWVTVRETISGLPEPVARGEEAEIPNHIQHPGARIYKGHIGSFWGYPSKALKAGTHGTPGGENVIRVQSDGSEVRYYTTREAGRLHTFPDNWEFLGSWGACIKQLGNAVPVQIAQLYADEIHRRLAPIAVKAHHGD